MCLTDLQRPSPSLLQPFPAPLSLYPFSPLKGNWRQRLQLVRQLDSCFVLHSSSHANADSLLFPSLIYPSLVPFCCFFFFFNIPVLSGIALCLEPRLADVRSNVFLQCTEIIRNSLSCSVVHFLFIASPSSFSPLSLHLSRPAPASSSITGGLV